MVHDLLFGDLHQLAEHLVHRLAALLEDVDQRMLRTRWVVIAILEAEHVTCTLRPLAARSLHAHVGRKRRSSSAAR